MTLFYNELQMSTYVADKCLQWTRGLPVFIAVWRLHATGKVKFWTSFIKCQYFNDGWRRIFTKVFISISLSWAFFRKPEKLGSHTGSKWWPIDRVTQWPSSMSDTHNLFGVVYNCRRLYNKPFFGFWLPRKAGLNKHKLTGKSCIHKLTSLQII